jgi:hypothetical protein
MVATGSSRLHCDFSPWLDLLTKASLENYQRAERFLPGTCGIRFTSRT